MSQFRKVKALAVPQAATNPARGSIGPAGYPVIAGVQPAMSIPLPHEAGALESLGVKFQAIGKADRDRARQSLGPAGYPVVDGGFACVAKAAGERARQSLRRAGYPAVEGALPVAAVPKGFATGVIFAAGQPSKAVGGSA